MKQVFFERYIGGHEEEINYLVENLKREDQAEADLIYGEGKTREVLIASLNLSKEAYIVRGESGTPIWVFGIENIETERGYCVWLVSTEESYQYKREFLIHSKRIVNEWKEIYGKLYNCIPVEYKKALRWVQYLGATFLEEVEHNGGKVQFYEIV